jgi:archaellum component FlaC
MSKESRSKNKSKAPSVETSPTK